MFGPSKKERREEFLRRLMLPEEEIRILSDFFFIDCIEKEPEKFLDNLEPFIPQLGNVSESLNKLRKCALLLQSFPHKKTKRFINKKLGVLVVDLYRELDWPLRPGMETTHYEYGTRPEGLEIIRQVLQDANNHGHNIYATTYQQPGANGQVIDTLSRVVTEFVNQRGIVVKPMLDKDNVSFDAFYKTDLHQRLQSDGIGVLLILGQNRDICVKETINGALSLGYKVITSEQLMFSLKRERIKSLESIKGRLDFRYKYQLWQKLRSNPNIDERFRRVILRVKPWKPSLRKSSLKFFRKNKDILYFDSYEDVIKFLENYPVID